MRTNHCQRRIPAVPGQYRRMVHRAACSRRAAFFHILGVSRPNKE
nr:MAG TPA_asm: hypothetical protein [Caudoviricetes sp.]